MSRKAALIFGAAVACAPAQSPSGVRGAPSVADAAASTIAEELRGAFIALSVRNVDSLSVWYRDRLGFQILRAGTAPNGIAKFAILESAGSIIEMVQHRDARPRTDFLPGSKGAHEIHGFFKAGFNVGDLDRAYRFAQERGVTIAYPIFAAPDLPLRSFTIRDPEGNLVQFFGQ